MLLHTDEQPQLVAKLLAVSIGDNEIENTLPAADLKIDLYPFLKFQTILTFSKINNTKNKTNKN